MAAARANLRKDLADSQKKWEKEAAQTGGVIPEGARPHTAELIIALPAHPRGLTRARVAGIDVAAPAPVSLPEIQLLDQNTFYPALTAAGSTLVLVDFYTDWRAHARPGPGPVRAGYRKRDPAGFSPLPLLSTWAAAAWEGMIPY